MSCHDPKGMSCHDPTACPPWVPLPPRQVCAPPPPPPSEPPLRWRAAHGPTPRHRRGTVAKGGFLDKEFHESGVLHNMYFREGEDYVCRGIWEDYDPKCCFMSFVQLNDMTIHLGFTYEGLRMTCDMDVVSWH